MLQLPFEFDDGRPMTITMPLHELISDYGASAIAHHGDSLWDPAEDDDYFIKENRCSCVAWRFLYFDEFNYNDEKRRL